MTLIVAGVIFSTLGTENSADSEGPPLSGQMKNFVLAKSIQPRPKIKWKDAEGNDVSLDKFSGKVVLLNFWATWCPPCVRELPSINRLQKTLGGDSFTVVALNIDLSGKPAAVPMVKRLNLDALDLYLDPTQISSKSLGLQAMPTTYLFSREGNILGLFRGGAEWDSKEARSLLKFFIDNPSYVDGLRRVRG